MSLVKSISVGNGDMFYIQHNSDNFTIIDCCISDANQEAVVSEIKNASKGKGITRFISTHPDEDHIAGLKYLDEQINIRNFYVVKNSAVKSFESPSFDHYCALRDSDVAYYVYKGCKRKWMNQSDETRSTAGISILWPNLENGYFKEALQGAEDGLAFNNISLVCRYSIEDGASFMWIGDLETEFMEKIVDDIDLSKTTIVFAPHHGRKTGKIPNSWLEKLDPQIIVVGEAPSRHLHYYTGYDKMTQNLAGDIIMDCVGNKVHIYASNPNYEGPGSLADEGQAAFDYYVGSLTVETEYTL